jgi:hypothetical protein
VNLEQNNIVLLFAKRRSKMSRLFKPLVAAVGIGVLVVASFAPDAHAFQLHSRPAPLTHSWGSLGGYPTQSRPGVFIGHLPQHASRVYAPQLPYRAPSPHFFRYDPARMQANQQIFRQRQAQQWQAQQYNNARAQWDDDRARSAKQQYDKMLHDQQVRDHQLEVIPWHEGGTCPYPYGGYYRC